MLTSRFERANHFKMMANGESSGREHCDGADSPNGKEKMVYKVVLTGGM